MIDQLVYRAHQEWRERHARLAVTRERWTDADWAEARRLADAAFDASNGRNLYLYAAEEALRVRHYERTAARLAAEARLGVEWRLGVLEASR